MILRSVALGLLLGAFVPPSMVTAKEYADAQSAAEDPDFAVQGEYFGGGRGMQAIAAGDGQFTVVIYEGGLPGAGWRKEPTRRIDVDVDAVKDLVKSMEMERVERSSPTLGATPPPGAVLLFDGSQDSVDAHWQTDAKLGDNGLLLPGATTKAMFDDYTLHLEFRTPFDPTATGQGRGNSGVYHQGRYETQILDSFGLTGLNNETGGIYTVRDPDLNMCFPPLVWQTYDIDFTAARYDDEGNRTSPPRLTVRLNGVVVQNDIPVPHATRAAPNPEGPSAGPVYLQDHGNQVRFRNIWVVPRDVDREARRPLVPGYERFYANPSLPSSAAGGHVLLSNLGCGNCHAGQDSFWQRASGPQLTDVASRLRPDHLIAWIADPHSVKPGTTMPDVLHGMNAESRIEAAKAIASYVSLRGAAVRRIDRAGDSRAAARGESLFHSVGCVACHAPRNGLTAPPATSVPLGPVEAKYTLDSLAEFLADPRAMRPGGRMPRLVAGAAEARDIATYLLGDTVLVPGAGQFIRTLYRGVWEKLPDFAALESLGPPVTVHDLTFDGVAPLDGFGAVYEAFLPISKRGNYRFILGSDDGSRLVVDDREVMRVDGMHPYQTQEKEIELAEGVHRLRVEYFEYAGDEQLTLEIEGEHLGRSDIAALVTQDPDGAMNRELVPATFQPDENLIAQGSTLFRTLGCVNCHAFEEAGQRVAAQGTAPPLDQVAPGNGCLSDKIAEGFPLYDLTAGQTRSLRMALQSLTESADSAGEEEQIHLTLAAANCYACHTRNDRGGPESARDALFQTTTPEMGNEGRVPPPLSGIGDKLTDAYLATILDQGAHDRPYMLTRMPAFGYEALQEFHQALVRVDRMVVEDAPDASAELAAHRLAADGRTLVGNDGLACIKCHTFRGQGASGIQAIDMLKMTDRLRPDWFDRYLRDPQRYRPGTRMPASFPDGRSVLTTIAGGEPSHQIAAMWTYLSAGEEAKIPAGLLPGAIELKPEDRPIMYRNFLAAMHPGAIAVGYPEGVHLAWEARSMSLSRIWQNQFLDASLHWRGRGNGELGPLGDAVMEFEQAAPVALISAVDAEWPQETGRESGYRLLGYRLDDAGRPTFRYSLRGAEIEDFPQPIAGQSAGPGSFLRRITIRSTDDELVFRGAAGRIRPVDATEFLIDEAIRVRFEGVEVQMIQVGDHQELRARIPAQSTTVIQQHIQW